MTLLPIPTYSTYYTTSIYSTPRMCVCVCVCVCWEGKGERKEQWKFFNLETNLDGSVCVCELGVTPLCI